MATKTINLKMILNRSESAEAKELRQALWTTHEAVNKAVAEIERVLLLCRGRSYWVRDKDKDGKEIDREVKAEVVRNEALEMARRIQQKNGKSNTGSKEEILNALRGLYEDLVPSSLVDKDGEPIKGDGSQKIGSSYALPLMKPDPAIGPFSDIVQKKADISLWLQEIPIEQYPKKEKIKAKKTGNDQYANYGEYTIKQGRKSADDPVNDIVYYFKIDFEKARQWENEEGKTFIEQMDHLRGRKNTWLNQFKEHKHTEWPISLAENQFELKHDFKITAREVLWKELGLLPLIDPQFEFSEWNALALRLALAHLLQFESWNHRCKKEHAELTQKMNKKKERVNEIQPQSIITKVRNYEQQRHQDDLKKNDSLSKPENIFKINPHMLLALKEIKEHWSKNKCETTPDREKVLDKLQSQMPGKFGDHHFYNWLAQEENKCIWQHEDNPLYEISQLNAIEKLLKKRKQQSRYTPPDAIEHPKWAQFEGLGGGNLKTYELIKDENGLSVELSLLCRTENGITEKKVSIPCAKSEQIIEPNVQIHKEKNTKWQSITFKPFKSSNEKYTGTCQGSDILFNKNFLKYKDIIKIQNGNWGKKSNSLDVWFKLVLDIEPKAPEGWINAQGKLSPLAAINHFKSGLLNKKHKEVIEPGLRVLSVDLGVRTFASCSVFELVKGKPAKGLCWLADKDKDLWAKHERSFTLTMPGDDISTQAQAARRKAYDELAALRQGKNFIRSLLALSVIEDVEKRTKQFTMLGSGKETFTGRETAFKLSNEDIAALTPFLQKPLPVWQAQVKMIFDRYEKIVSDAVSEWRNRTRPKDRDREYEMGKSYWGIEYLEKVRDFLKGWSTHAREYGKINRWDRETLGTFASDLLEHINNKKEDRIKTGTDLIIQAARGKVYNKKTHKWEDKFEPCRLILFEDLKMYRFKTDRPKWENSQLMRWSHREIQKEAGQQAAIYGIHIDTTGAGFSSKFYAKNGCPGVRAKKLTRADLDYINSNKSVRTRLAEEGFHNGLLKEGTVVPWPGGEFFASLNDKGNLEIIHADINAAQNLQRRIWTRYADTWRVPVKQINSDGSQWIAQYDSKRIRGGLSLFVESQGFAKFIQTPDGSGFIPEALAESLWKKLSGQTVAKSEEEKESGFDQVEEYLEAAGATTDDDEGKGKEVFFRDASGMILNKDRFYPSKEFWGRVHQTINKALKDRMENHEPNPF